ncbi:spore coat protein CotJB [Paenibacillus thermotolerans]|uniref:spore coat protein CotJB n=1 Tax=Paenibacillus thermotolerans TaxID=3027807 RepID=UPI002367A9AD|nr:MULTISPECIES: spore coat protein CotJB [unclassified Paenibacillus]
MKPVLDERYYQMLHELQTIDFVLVELNLYLDTHPNDQAALDQYNQTAMHRAQIAHNFESLYGPLRNFGQSLAGSPFSWAEGPWPWQV